MDAWEWLYCTDPNGMLDLLGARVSDRKQRLFALACCRRLWHLIPVGPCRNAVAVADRFADREATREELVAACNFAWFYIQEALVPSVRDSRAIAAQAAAYAADPGSPVKSAESACLAAGWGSLEGQAVERAAQAAIIRDIFGDLPFHRPAVGPSWLTPTVVTMAGGIYAEKGFDLMPVLGDALEDAGCNDASILAHCRGSGEHVRGCWVVDLLLGKE
jgi:hypothetical protein